MRKPLTRVAEAERTLALALSSSSVAAPSVTQGRPNRKPRWRESSITSSRGFSFLRLLNPLTAQPNKKNSNYFLAVNVV
jgi:hypothetical protein